MDENPIKPDQVSEQAAENSQDSPSSPPVPSVDIGKENSPTKSTDASANKKKRKRKPLSCGEVWTVALWIISVVVAGGTGVAIYWQDRIAAGTLNELHKEYPQLQRSTAAAEASARVANETLKQSIAARRPYVIARLIGTMKISKHGKPIQANIQLINWGQSIAMGVTFDGHIWFGRGSNTAVDKYFDKIPKIPRKYDISFLIPNMQGNVGSSPSFKYTTIDSWNEAPGPKAIQFILHNDAGVIAAGRIWYKDTTGTRYRTDFCIYTLLSHVMADCPEHNEIH